MKGTACRASSAVAGTGLASFKRAVKRACRSITQLAGWPCACRYVRESKVLFKVCGYADKALAGADGAVSPLTPGGPHSSHGAPMQHLVQWRTLCSMLP